jgi:hypothetical protein
LDSCILGRYLLGIVNDDFNGLEVIVSYHLATSRTCDVGSRLVLLYSGMLLVASALALSCCSPPNPFAHMSC